MIWVIDASVALKWFLRFRPEEDGVVHAMDLLEQAVSGAAEVFQPPHFYAEMAAVLAREKPDTAPADLHDLLQLDFGIADGPGIYASAIDLSRRFGHHLFDTLYHAVALQTPGATLVTADLRYFAKAQGEGRIRLLNHLPGTDARDG